MGPRDDLGGDMWKTVCRAQDVPANGMKEFPLDGGGRVLLVNAGAEYFACQALCPHETVPLQDGVHDGAVLTCLEHLWQFDLRTGAPVGDAEAPLATYRVKEENGALLVWDGPPGEG
jgi:toluene monooxygenase system ferredoxin subunit